MRLDAEFYRLPLRFDADRLREEVSAFQEDEWSPHPQGFEGNSALVLISAHGEINNLNRGPMLPTGHLARAPYIRQVLATFNTVVGRSRLMRLAPEAVVPTHTDIHPYWHRRVRVHVPITTHPAVQFTCGKREVHMGAGEAWLLDTWRRHGVRNESPVTRVHLVFDTVGSAAFWDLVERGDSSGGGTHDPEPRLVPWDPTGPDDFPTERYNLPTVMTPEELEFLVEDALAQLHLDDLDRLHGHHAPFVRQTESFLREWRATWAMHGDGEEGHPTLGFLQKSYLLGLASLPKAIRLETNAMPLRSVLQARVAAALSPDPHPEGAGSRLNPVLDRVASPE